MEMDPAVNKAINDQVRKELASAYLYLAMAAWFERQNLPGFARWMRVQSKEELEHAERLFDHLVDRGEPVSLAALEAPPADFGSVRAAVEQVAAHERMVSESIHAIYELAAQKKDYATKTMLHWFVDEQVEEEKLAADLLGRLDLVEQRKGSLLMVDKELGSRGSEK